MIGLNNGRYEIFACWENVLIAASWWDGTGWHLQPCVARHVLAIIQDADAPIHRQFLATSLISSYPVCLFALKAHES